MKISTWGSSKINLGTMTVRGATVEDVCRSIERRTRMRVITCRPDGWSLSTSGDREYKSTYYQITLGYALRSGGYSPEATIWIAVPHA